MAKPDRTHPKLQVAVISVDGISASALIALLAEHESLEPVVAADSSDTQGAPTRQPDVFLVDLSRSFAFLDDAELEVALPDLGRIEGVPALGLLSDLADGSQAWRSGYRSLILRSESPHALVSALHSVADGLWVLSPRIINVIVSPSTRAASNASEPEFDELTERELQVLDLLAEGLTNRAVAHRLHISEHTVKFHVNSILSKLGAESRTDAVVRATRAGLILL